MQDAGLGEANRCNADATLTSPSTRSGHRNTMRVMRCKPHPGSSIGEDALHRRGHAQCGHDHQKTSLPAYAP